MRFAFFLREALRSVSRNAVPSFAAMASVLVTVLVLGVFIPVVQATTGAANEVRGRVLVNVYLKTDATAADVERVRRLLADRVDHVGRVEYVSKQQAYEEQRRRYPEAYDLLGSNPLPDTFRVTPDKPDNALRLRDALAPPAPGGGRTTIDPAIEVVKNSRDDTRRILVATRVVKLTTGLLAVLLVVASVLLVSNTIRLSLFSRRRMRSTIAWSCVATSTVVPVRLMRYNSCMIPIDVSGSRLPVGSSASSSGGWLTNARATETRCCSPPESWSGRLCSFVDRPVRRRMSGTLARISRREPPVTCSA